MNTDQTITVQLEGRAHPVTAGTTLAALVDTLGHEPAAVTTALNGRFVPRDQRHLKELQADDAVLLFQPIVGG